MGEKCGLSLLRAQLAGAETEFLKSSCFDVPMFYSRKKKFNRQLTVARTVSLSFKQVKLYKRRLDYFVLL